MTGDYQQIIVSHSIPLDPIPTGQQPKLQRLPSVRAVLFDVYGTLLISSSGDVDSDDKPSRGLALAEAFCSMGIQLACDGSSAHDEFTKIIKLQLQRSRDRGIEYAEVDILDVWRQTLQELHCQNRIHVDPAEIPLRQLAFEFEVRANPVWPMRGAGGCLEELARCGIVLGLISNAQFWTAELLQTLLKRNHSEFEFDPGLQYYSYEHGQAKPGRYLYHLAAEELKRRGIATQQVLYVGNDMLNDIMPAQKCGFLTAWFSGDARSSRCRSEDPRVEGVKPDVVITDFRQLSACIR